MKIQSKYYVLALEYFLLAQGISICNATSVQTFEELNKDVGRITLRDSETSEDSAMKEGAHSPSIAQIIFKRACEIIPNLQNPELVKPSFKNRFSFEYYEKFRNYDHLKTLNKYFIGAINGDSESKEFLAFWLLKGIQDISQDFYVSYGANATDSKLLLKEHIQKLLNEYRDFPDPDLDINPDALLADLDYYVAKW